MSEHLPEWNTADFFSGPDDSRYQQIVARIVSGTIAVTDRKSVFVSGALSMPELATFFSNWNRVVEDIELVHAWTTFRYHRDTNDAAAKSFLETATRAVADWHAAFVWITSGIQQWSADYAKQVTSAVELAPYHWMITQTQLLKPHTLSDGEERVIALKRATSHEGWSRLRLELENKQDPGTMTVDGKEMQIKVSGQILTHHADPAVRLEAHQRIKEAFAPQIDIYAHAYQQVVGDYETESRNLRGYASGMHREVTESAIPEGAVETMLAEIESRHDLFRRFYAIKKKMLKIPELTSADIYAPLPGEDGKRSYDQAWHDVRSALTAFSSNYAGQTELFATNSWIDVPVKATKYKGAYCWGAPDHPYLLLNFESTLRDVFTLVHELGHGVHALYAGKIPLVTRHTAYVIAETASQMNEELLLDYYRTALPPDQFRSVLAAKIDDTLNALFRQGLLARFELLAHEQSQTSGLSAEWLNATWLRLVTERNGDALKTLPFEQYEWARIPHIFDHPYYVYAYAMSMCVVRALVEKRRQMGADFVLPWQKFLAAGGTASPEDLLTTHFGVSLKNADTYRQALDSAGRMIDECESLC